MCCRVTLVKTIQEAAAELGIDLGGSDARDFKPSYNCSPGQALPVLFESAGAGRAIAMMRWGVSSESRGGDKIELFNARAESLLEKRNFKILVPRNRAALIADGYFEWREDDGVKIPYYIRRADGRLMLIAALFSPDAGSRSFTVVTREPLPEISFIHPRMPAIVDGAGLDAWLDVGNVSAESAIEELASFSGRIQFHTVSRFVNSVKNNSPECIRPANYPEQPGLF